MKPTRWIAVGLLAVVGIVLGAIAVFGDESEPNQIVGPPSSRPQPPAKSPNVVVVMTDDQALDTMVAMPKTRRLLGRHGTTYENAVVTYPLCCPSRATFLTGQYAHNHGVLDNHPPNGGYGKLDIEHTLPIWLQRRGYLTAFVGKYLNGYGKGDDVTDVPPGWDEWYALPGKNKQRSYDFELNENGELVTYGGDERRHKATVLGDKTVQVLDELAPERRPFFLWLATNGPHRDSGLPDDAPRNPVPEPPDLGKFEGKHMPDTSATRRDLSDKPESVQKDAKRVDRETLERLDREYVSQLETLLGIDRTIGRIVETLREHGELENTVIIFTSDNGFLRGQHGLEGKASPYEESILVPLIIRGPGFAAGATDRALAPNIDLAATILDVTGAEPDIEVDGRTLRRDPDGKGRDAVLLEVYGRKRSFTGVRTDRYVWAEHETGEYELYDLAKDPLELHNLADDPAYADVREKLEARLAELRECSGPKECG